MSVPVAGIGASAGGIRALQSFFEALPPRVGVAFVVVVHLDPNHASELASVLSKHTQMRVEQVHGRTPLAVDTIYVIPPNRRLLVTDGDIDIAPFVQPRGQRAPIDEFLCSLAEQRGDGFAIVLSGGGSDGSIGAREIRANGGLILVQDPEEAEYGSMPRNAIASGADFVLPVKELAKKVVALVKAKAHINADALVGNDANEDVLRSILNFVRVKTGQDFSKYKRATVMRRLARRMQVAQTDTLEAYLDYLRSDANEARELFNDFLISVTSFFRDADAFKVLAEKVVPALFDRNVGPSGGSIRVWVAGCATGEEAYSVAILILEEAALRDVRADIQVFATDLDAHGLAAAREGRYPSSISADVSEERLRRFFQREGDHYRVRRELRDLVVFALHGILRDPPFSRVDLATCRNLMIYLDRDSQQQVCTILHYALASRGFLFLGNSETAESPVGLFAVVDRDARIYQALDRPSDRLPLIPRGLGMLRVADPGQLQKTPSTKVTDSTTHRQILEDIAPPSMLVDERQIIVNLSESAGRYLFHPGGPVTVEAGEVVRPELRLELRTALHRVFEHGLPSVSLPLPVQFNGTPTSVVVHVRPIQRDNARLALVMFLEGASLEALPFEPSASGADLTVVNQLREELSATRAVLRSTRDQYGSATEELRAANEELQSINEEYRSTAEELETSKEELQSINEELQTVNSELKLKLEMVSRAHNDLQNLISATDVGTMFLDVSLRIQRFTPKVVDVFNIQNSDEGRPITDFTHRLQYPDLVKDARRVLADLIPIERTVKTDGGRWYLVRLRPYRTTEDKIEGVVVTFVDVTERRQSEESWEKHQTMLLHELSHRVKNTLAVVQAVTRLTLRSSVPSRLLDTLDQRLDSLSKAHDLLVSSEWRGASLEALARQQIAAYLTNGSNNVRLSGPPVILPPAIATPLGLVLHELATNAAKYGALSAANGLVSLSWETRDLDGGVRVLLLNWVETGGPPVARPAHNGAGSELIAHALPGAEVSREFKPGGVFCSITLPLSRQRATSTD